MGTTRDPSALILLLACHSNPCQQTGALAGSFAWLAGSSVPALSPVRLISAIHVFDVLKF